MPTFMLPVNIDNEPQPISALGWTYLADQPDVIIDGVRYGFIQAQSPIMEDVDGFDILFVAMCVINQTTLDTGILKPFGEIVFTLVDFSDIADHEIETIENILLQSNFPGVDYKHAPPVKTLSQLP